MKKKIFRTLGLIFLVIVGVFGFVGCKSDNGNDGDGGNNNKTPTPTPSIENTVTVSFISRYGTLSFNDKTYELENGYVFIDSTDFPTVTGEGDSIIFDKWLYEDNTEFKYDNPVTKDITLHASFVNAEYVWVENWEMYDDVHSLYRPAFIDVSGDHNSYYTADRPYPEWNNYLNEKDPTFTKIKSYECLESYITKDEYRKLAGYCFITSSDRKTKIVTESDITTNTYSYCIDILIGNQEFGCYNRGYLPKGVSMYDTKLLSKNSYSTYYRKGSALFKLFNKFVDENSVYIPSSDGKEFNSSIDVNTSKNYVVFNDHDLFGGNYSLDDIRSMCTDDNYTCNYDFNDNSYIAYICVDYIYCYDKNLTTGEEYFSFIATDWNSEGSIQTLVKLKCTKEEFEEMKNKYIRKSV